MTVVLQARFVRVLRGLCVSLIAGESATVCSGRRPADGDRLWIWGLGRSCCWGQRTGGGSEGGAPRNPGV